MKGRQKMERVERKEQLAKEAFVAALLAEANIRIRPAEVSVSLERENTYHCETTQDCKEKHGWGGASGTVYFSKKGEPETVLIAAIWRPDETVPDCVYHYHYYPLYPNVH